MRIEGEDKTLPNEQEISNYHLSLITYCTQLMKNKKDKLPSYFFNFSIMVIFVGQ